MNAASAFIVTYPRTLFTHNLNAASAFILTHKEESAQREKENAVIPPMFYPFSFFPSP